MLCMGVWWWRCVSPRGWVCLGETLVFVCLLPVLMSCVRSCSCWVRPALSLWCSLVVLPRISECSRMGVRQYSGSLAHPRGMYYNGKEGRKAELFFVMFIVNIIMLYSLQYRYYQVCEIIFFIIFDLLYIISDRQPSSY